MGTICLSKISWYLLCGNTVIWIVLKNTWNQFDLTSQHRTESRDIFISSGILTFGRIYQHTSPLTIRNHYNGHTPDVSKIRLTYGLRLLSWECHTPQAVFINTEHALMHSVVRMRCLQWGCTLYHQLANDHSSLRRNFHFVCTCTWISSAIDACHISSMYTWLPVVLVLLLCYHAWKIIMEPPWTNEANPSKGDIYRCLLQCHSGVFNWSNTHWHNKWINLSANVASLEASHILSASQQFSTWVEKWGITE